MMEIKVKIIKFNFYGTTFEAYNAGGGLFLVPVKDLVDALGMDLSAQIRRIQRHPVLNNCVHTLKLERLYGEKGETRMQEVMCLDLRKMPFYLGGTDPGRIEDADKYQRVITFQEYFAEIAWAAFRTEMLTDPEMLSEVDMYESPAKREYNRMMDDAAAVRRMVEDVENTVGSLKPLVDEVQQLYNGQADLKTLIDEVVTRLRIIEARMAVSTLISGMEALTIRKVVQQLGAVLTTKHRKGGKNQQYWTAHVYDGFYREFGITSFYNLDAADFEKTLSYFKAVWRNEVGAEPPDEFGAWQPAMFD